MNIRTIRRGCKLLSRHPKSFLLVAIYMYTIIWYMSRDGPDDTSINRKDELTWTNGIAILFVRPSAPSVENTDAAKKTATPMVKIDSEQKSKSMKQTREVEPRRHINISKIGHFKVVHGVDEEGGVHNCNMKKYIDVNKQECQNISSAKSRFKTGLSRTHDVRNSLTNKGNFNNFSPVNSNKRINTCCDIDNVFFNCEALQYSYLYGKHAVTEEEELFPLAFAMKIHRSDNQAHRLLRYIYRKHNVYCIHIDTKAPAEIYFKFKQIGQCFDNVHIIEDRVNVIYSTIRQVEAEFKCMEAMVKHGNKWKYYINLTGQEFMLKTNLEIVKVLKLLNGTNDIESYPMPPDQQNKFRQRTLITKSRGFITKQQKAPFRNDITIHKGSAYGMFSREFVEYVLTDRFVKTFYDWLKDTYAPEEMIWATLNILPDTPGGQARTITGNAFLSRTVKWEMDSSVTCKGKYVHYVCVYGTGDIPWLLSHHNIVANKFYEYFQPLALDCVENEMYLRLMTEHINNTFDITYYKNVLEKMGNS